MDYRVFLAEDETMIRENIVENEMWNQGPFKLLGSASNGEEALVQILKLPVDILITDIRMPFMDGLELSSKVKEQNPKIHIIILSGYSEFEYAKKAIEIGVTEYLMKPVTPKGLLSSLQKVAAAIDRERCVEKSLQQLNTIMEKNKELPIRKFLSRLSGGFLTEEQIVSQAEQLNLSIFKPFYTAAVADLSRFRREDSFYYEFTDEIASLFSIPEQTYYFLENDSSLCLLFLGDQKEELIAAAESTCKRLMEYLAPCTIGIGSVCESAASVWHSFFTARAALTMKELTYSGDIRRASDYDNSSRQDYFLALQKDLVLNFLRFGKPADIDSILLMLRGQIVNSKISSVYFIYLGMELCFTVKNFLSGLSDKLPAEFEQYAYGIISPSSGVHEIEHFLKLIRKLLLDALAFRDRIQSDKYGDVIAQAKEYISLHFSSPELSLVEVSEAVNISPAYFSSLFSHETGETFIEYLTDLRIRRAKELLKTSSMRTTDIAFEVGYRSTNHFGKMFKRIAGQSPREYRSSQETNWTGTC